MAICHFCKQDLREVAGCDIAVLSGADGRLFARIPYGKEHAAVKFAARCPDCYAVFGKLHHPSCVREDCPSCHKKIAACHCALVISPAVDISEVEPPRQPDRSPVANSDAAALATPLPRWQPASGERLDSLTALRIGHLAGCWKLAGCKISVSDGQLRHECPAGIDLVPLTTDAEVAAILKARHRIEHDRQ